MLKISDYFKDKDGRSLLFSALIWGTEWEAMGLPKVPPIDRMIYCHLFCFGGRTGLSKSAIVRAIWGSGDYRTSAGKALERLREHNLVEAIDKLWIALLPKLSPKDVSIHTKNVQINTVCESTHPVLKNTENVQINTVCESTQCVNQHTKVCRSTQGGCVDLHGKVCRSTHQQERDVKKKRTTTTDKEIREVNRTRSRSDGVVGVDYSNFDPLQIWRSEPAWLAQDLAPPSDPKDYNTWLHFAADCNTWRRLNKPDAKPLTSPTAYASACRKTFFESSQQGIDAIQAALEMAQTIANRRKIEAKSQRLRDQNAPPRVRQFTKDDQGPENFADWVTEICPELDARLKAFRECCKGEHAGVLEPHQQRLDNAIRLIEERLNRISVPRAIWCSKVQGVGQIHQILQRAREELESA